jgi:hypothetical protein
MNTLAIIFIGTLATGILFVLAGVLLRGRTQRPRKTLQATCVGGGILCALALLGLPFLAATGQLSPAAALSPKWPVVGHMLLCR